jgi:hypothetical protein
MDDRIKKDIYKLSYINNTNIDGDQIPTKIIVFYGRTNPVTKQNWDISVDELKEKFASYIEKIIKSKDSSESEQKEGDEEYVYFNDIFSNTELENINAYKINVEFSFDRLYGDDTIETVKKKIISNMKIENSPSFDELYIFSKRGIEYTPTQLYNKLSNNDTSTITRTSLINFLTNSHRWNLKQECELILKTSKDELKDVYTYEDIMELFFRYKKEKDTGDSEGSGEQEEEEEEEIIEESIIPLIEDIPIGQKLTYNQSEYTFTINPFNVVEIDKFLKDKAKNIISTTNKTILLDYQPIICNTIFVCLATDVLEYIESFNSQADQEKLDSLTSDTMIQIYYPYLAEKEYTTISALESNRRELEQSTSELINDKSYKDLIENVDLFYDVFYQKEKDKDLKYVKKGISYIELEIKPDSIINIPIDILFKILHTTDEKPLIKLTRNKRDEKMYRLYANKVARSGKRIPYLKKSEIKKIMKETQQEKRVMVLIHFIHEEYQRGEYIGDYKIPIKCEFDNHGSIFISFKLEQPLNDDNITKIIEKSVNPVIQEVATFIEQYGYSMTTFHSLYSKNVIIREIKYKTLLKLPHDFKFNIPENMGCISSIFNVIEYKEGQRIIMRYKRVSNYNEMESIDAFIMQQFLKSSYQADVVTGLMENYQSLTYSEAVRRVSNLLDQLQLSELNKQTKIKVNIHPGFFTSIIQYQIVTNGNFEINVENIDNIYYLDHIEKMIDSFLRLLLYKKSEPNTNVSGEQITKLCKKSFNSKEQSEIKEVKEFVVHGDKSVLTDNTMMAETNPVDDTFVFENFSRPEDLQKIDDADLEDLFFGSEGEGSGSEEEGSEEEGSEEEGKGEEGKGEESGSESVSSKSIEQKVEEEQKVTSAVSPGEEREEEGDVIENMEFGSDEEESEGEGEEDQEEGEGEQEEGEGEEGEGEQEEEGDVIENMEFGSDDEDKDSDRDSIESGGGSSSEEGTPIAPAEIPSFSSDTEKEETPKPAPKPKSAPKKSINVTGLSLASKTKASSAPEESGEGVTLFQRGTIERDITGAKLSNPNPVFQRLYSLDPVLFPKNTAGNIKEYSRSCPWNVRRQPIILTDEEKRHIDENHAGSYDRAMKYGSSQSKKYWYICPRYWDLKKNVSLTHEEVEKIKAKEGDVVIPPGAETIPAGKYIFEFTEDKYHIDKKTGQYKSQSPGFVDSKENAGSKYCIPCCFNSENFAKDKQNTARQACGCPSITVHNQRNPNTKSFDCKGKDEAFKAAPVRRVRGKGKSTGEEAEGEEEEPQLTSEAIRKSLARLTEEGKDVDILGEGGPAVGEEDALTSAPPETPLSELSLGESAAEAIVSRRTVAPKKDFVILGPERNAELPEGVYGYLLPQLQAFFSQSMKTCTLNEKSTVLKPGVSCLLQKGVQTSVHVGENNKNQSFIGSVADIYSKYIEELTGKYNKVSISEMKKIIIDSIDIDTFMTYQNGTLVNTFNYKQKANNSHYEEDDDERNRETNVGAESQERSEETPSETPRTITSTSSTDQGGGGSSSEEEGEGSETGQEQDLLDYVSEADAKKSENMSEELPIESMNIESSEEEEEEEEVKPQTTPSGSESDTTTEERFELKNKESSAQEQESQQPQDICIVDDDVFRLMLQKSDFEYKDSTIFKSITKMSNTDAQFIFFKKVVCSFENFKKYINSKTIYIDYQYLWDIISTPNPKLFKDGLNLIILQISNRDITNNIEVLCPTNHYSNGFFDSNRETAILIKRNVKDTNIFEPIYEIRELKPRKITCLFNIKSTAVRKYVNQSGVEVKEAALPPVLKKIITNIKNAYDGQCKPYNSIPREGTANASKKFPRLYEFSRNIHLYELTEKVARGGFTILNQILNYDGRVIGIFIEKEDEELDNTFSGIVMCEPSPIDKTIPQINYIDDESLWRPYEVTVTFLHYVRSKIKIPCLPKFKVIDDGKIAGIITETDQFISVSIDESESKRTDGIFNIPVINTSDYNIADTEINTRLKDDPDREKYVKYIYLENNFYNVFRTIVRILLHKFENVQTKESILSIIKRNDMLYLIKLSSLQTLIRRLVSNYISFSTSHYTEELLKSMSEITTSCVTNKNPNTCSDTKYCIKETDKEGRCKLIIPKVNLLNPSQNNEVMYIARMADEILRYNRIRAFMFDRNIFPLINVKYNLREDEIILSQTMLSEDYLDNLEPVPENEYANFNTYDTAEPLLTELYESIYDTPSSQHVKCTTEKIFLTQEYRKYFTSKQTRQLEMLKFNSNSPRCSFEIILFILKLEAKRRNYKRLETITINHLKVVIAQFYIDTIDKQYTEGIKDRFAKLLKYYGMESISDEYRIKFIANEDDNFIETLPFFESYHLTRLDIWILATYYKIPIIILYYPNKALLETKDEYSILTTYFEEGSSEKVTEEGEKEGKEKEDSDEDLPFMGESARPITREKLANVQGYYFIIAPAIKSNVVPSYSIIFRKGPESETSGLTGLTSGNEYYISLNILTHGFQSTVIQQQSTQYINPDEPPHSEDDESSQMKESIRYKNSIMQFIQDFKPPSKKGKGDDSSSVGTGVSLDTQEEDLGELLGKKTRVHKKPRKTINIPSLMFKSLAVPPVEASELGPSEQKRKPRVKGKGININTSSLFLPSKEQESVSVEPVKKTKAKKINIDTSKLPLFGAKVLPPQQENIDESTGLSDIQEEQGEDKSPQ